MIYLDNNATTMVDQEVIDSMIPSYTTNYGNPSSTLNLAGWNALNDVRKAKTILADYFHAKSENDFIFTSGATEANNLALIGTVTGMRTRGCHIIVSSIEHKSILESCHVLEQQGVRCTYLPVDALGRVDFVKLNQEICDETVLISIMGANNEIGTIQPIEDIGNIARKHGILFHTDLTQLIGFERIDVSSLPIDLFSFSAHKIHGPKGIGCLYANATARKVLQPLIFGGKQQLGFRSGTLNVPGIIGLSKAIEILDRSIEANSARIAQLRDLLWSKLQRLPDIRVNGDTTYRIPNNLNVTFSNISSLALAAKTPNLAFSAGSACLQGQTSYVLKAIGLTESQCSNTVRFGVSRFTTEAEIKQAANEILTAIDNAK